MQIHGEGGNGEGLLDHYGPYDHSPFPIWGSILDAARCQLNSVLALDCSVYEGNFQGVRIVRLLASRMLSGSESKQIRWHENHRESRG